VVDPEVGDEVPDEHIDPAELVAEKVQDGTSNRNTEITEQDQLLVLPLIQRARWDEVVDTAAKTIVLANTLAFGLLLVLVMAGDVAENVCWPTDELLTDEMEERSDGGILSELVELVGELAETRSVDLFSGRVEDHVAVKVASGLVVLAVGNLPREVRNKKCRVKDPANGVIDGLGRRERLMAALVCKNPDTSTEKTLKESVASPESRTNRHAWYRLGSDIVVEDVECGRQAGNVASDVGQASDGGPLEAVSRDRIAELLDSVVRNDELVAVRV